VSIQSSAELVQTAVATVEPLAGAAWPRAARTLPQCFEHTCDRMPGRAAVVVGAVTLTYAELDRRANQVAHLLRERGVGEGSTVGLLLERSVDTYVALLGVLKSGAAYVPLDPSFPADRVAYIAEDAGLRDLVTTSGSREVTSSLACDVLELDQVGPDLAVRPTHSPNLDVDPSSLSYVIYTSGSTGKPKGVAISHASIVNFLRVATPIYGVTSEDRVYQGMSISFDFHLEEMWPAWVAGATLIAGPTDSRRFGQGLTDFLVENRVTVFCSVPTLLTTIEQDPETVRCLLVSGEAMPEDVVRRWSRPGRRILNCYGPTETTVSSSCAELLPDRPVTLGRPFPTYAFYVLDEELRPVPQGAVGEICIGGPGTGVGYLNRPELTAERFIANPAEADRRTAPRVYRTGDLGRVTPTGEYEYLGRIDTQVKIRGYRIELGEIEQVIREDDAVENAVVTTMERDGVAQDLVGYVTVHERTGTDWEARLRERLHASLRRRLPPYMVPSYVEVLDALPLLAADKVNRAALPSPTAPPLGARSGQRVPPDGPVEAELVAAWEQVLDLPEVSVEDDFFCDLGGHSLTAARLISRLREEPAMAGLAMGDLYANPTVRSLAAFIGTGVAPAAAEAAQRRPPLRHSSRRVWACGVAQLTLDLLWLLAWSVPNLFLIYAVILHAEGADADVVGLPPALVEFLAEPTPVETALTLVIWLVWLLATLFLIPVAVSRLILRGVRPGYYPMWGLTFIRIWFYLRVSSLAPLAVLSGTPFEAPYLRAMGASIGRQCQLASATIRLPSFVTIGDRVSVNHGAHVLPYMIENGWLRIAPVTIGSDSSLGCTSVVLAGAEIGERTTIGDKSLVHADARIPADEHWAGSPIRPTTTVSPLLAAMAERADDRRWSVPVLLGYIGGLALLALLPIIAFAPSAALISYAALQHGITWAIASVLAAGPLFVLVACVVMIVAKRLVLRCVQPGIYSATGWFGVREWLGKNIAAESVGMIRTTYCTLYVIPFLRGLGMRIGRWCEIAVPEYIDPDMTVTGDQTFLAGGVMIGPPIYHRGCIAVEPAEMGQRSFIGNLGLLPSACRMSDNSLLGVLSVAPATIAPETTWLGSPAFFLPRRQESQKFPEKLTYAPTRGMIAGRLALEVFRVALPEMILALSLYTVIQGTIVLTGSLPPLPLLLVLPALELLIAVAATLFVALLKWLVMGRYRPRVEPYWGTWVRGTELITGLFEAVVEPGLVRLVAGTPFMGPVMRLFGASVGRRVYLTDGAGTELDLIHIGDDAVIGENTSLQTHLFEDRVMKMSYVTVEAGATVGPNSVVLYDAVVGAGTTLDGLSLVMKSEALPPNSRWRGIPARPL
jgi:non-ribosomal peptide synthetase-like protein